jgi:L-ascorbate metabolism protein UlaG (beta-lactamase superfamily)
MQTLQEHLEKSEQSKNKRQSILRLLRVTGNPKVIIPTHWDIFRLPYGFSQQSSVDLKLVPFREDVARLSPDTEVIIPVHLGTITLE